MALVGTEKVRSILGNRQLYGTDLAALCQYLFILEIIMECWSAAQEVRKVSCAILVIICLVETSASWIQPTQLFCPVRLAMIQNEYNRMRQTGLATSPVFKWVGPQ